MGEVRVVGERAVACLSSAPAKVSDARPSPTRLPSPPQAPSTNCPPSPRRRQPSSPHLHSSSLRIGLRPSVSSRRAVLTEQQRAGVTLTPVRGRSPTTSPSPERTTVGRAFADHRAGAILASARSSATRETRRRVHPPASLLPWTNRRSAGRLVDVRPVSRQTHAADGGDRREHPLALVPI
jgi:hypothetical protein